MCGIVERLAKWERRRARWSRWIVATISAMVVTPTVFAQNEVDPRGLALAEINNTPPFLVRVDVDHPDRVYHEGDTIQASVRAEREGYLYLFYCDANRQVSCLFPNQLQRDNFIPANKSILVPESSAKFRLRVGPPFGGEVFKAVVTNVPLKTLEIESLTKGDATALSPPKLKAVFVEVNSGGAASAIVPQGSPPPRERTAGPVRQWSEHCVPITTVASGQNAPRPLTLQNMPRLAGQGSNDTTSGASLSAREQTPGAGPKRVGVFIGIRNYADPGIRPLHVADRDAQAFADAMRRFGQLDDAVVLVNERATLKNVEAIIYGSLPAATRPGDSVFIYWSGHGGRTSNLDGTEPDGYDEYLVPYDGRLEPVEAVRTTMLLDKTFGRWVQNLDGRRLAVIIDACHSGGQTQGAIKAITAGDDTTPFRKFFCATMLQRTKDIGQRETAVLASSRATQVSFEQPGGDLSVMTHFLIELLGASAQPVSLPQAFEYVKAKVPSFVESHYPGTTQTPVLVDQTTQPILLRP
jgi:hypothetical protein